MRALALKSSGTEWGDDQKADVAAQVVGGTLSIAEVCSRHGLSPECIRDWVVQFRRSSLQAFDEHLRRMLASQGLDASGLAAAEFTGTLLDISIADLIQTMGLARKDGVIRVSHDGVESRIWCMAGEIVDAASGKLAGESAVYRILALQRGSVVAEFCPVSRARTIHSSTPGLLLEGAHQLDECSLLRQSLGTGTYVIGPAAMAVSASFRERELEILRLFAAPRSVAEVLAESELGDFETLSTVFELAKTAYLLPAGAASQTPPATAVSERRSRGPSLMDFLPAPASVRARRRRRALLLLGLAAGCAGWWAWTHGSVGASQARVRALEAHELDARVRPASAASAPRVAPAPAPVPALSEPAEQLAPTAAIQTAFAPADESVPVLEPGPPTRVARRTGTGPSASFHRPARARSAERSARESDALASSTPPWPKEAATSSQEATPRMQIIDEHAPRMQIVEQARSGPDPGYDAQRVRSPSMQIVE